MENGIGLKEIYSCVLKATYPIEVGGKTIETGEIIASFDKLQIANFHEVVQTVSAHGGFSDRGLVYWDTTREVKLSFTQGVFSPTQATLLTNGKLMTCAPSTIVLTQREELESDEHGSFELKENPSGAIFVYNKHSGEKLRFSRQEKIITIDTPYVEVVVDYEWKYNNGGQVLNIGDKLYNGFVALEGRVKIKEDITGIIKTGIIKIPRLKIVSNLSMRLGKDAVPLVGGFSAVASPDGPRGASKAMEIFILEDDIDSDM